MGTFPTPLPLTTHHIATVDMILTASYQSLESYDPWIVPSPLEFNALGDTVFHLVQLKPHTFLSNPLLARRMTNIYWHPTVT
jgi:hypothetical protein